MSDDDLSVINPHEILKVEKNFAVNKSGQRIVCCKLLLDSILISFFVKDIPSGPGHTNFFIRRGVYLKDGQLIRSALAKASRALYTSNEVQAENFLFSELALYLQSAGLLHANNANAPAIIKQITNYLSAR